MRLLNQLCHVIHDRLKKVEQVKIELVLGQGVPQQQLAILAGCQKLSAKCGDTRDNLLFESGFPRTAKKI